MLFRISRAIISAASPATESEHAVGDSDRRFWPGAGWLRIALLAGLAAGLIAAAFNLGVGARVVDEGREATLM